MPPKAPKLSRKLKILGLHGHAMAGDMMRRKIGSIRTEVKGTCEFEFPDAPITVEQQPNLEGGDEQPASPSTTGPETDSAASPTSLPPSQVYSWFDWWSNGDVDGVKGRRMYKDVDKALSSLATVCTDNGPFDGIFAFSQGCVIGTIWLSLLRNPPAEATAKPEELFADPDPSKWRLPESMHNVKFAIMCSGLLPSDNIYSEICANGAASAVCSSALDTKHAFRSLHIWGETDAIITPNRSLELMKQGYEPHGEENVDIKAIMSTHEGGHVVPSSMRKSVKSFVVDEVVPMMISNQYIPAEEPAAKKKK